MAPKTTMGRRQFLKLLGIGGTTALLVPAIPVIMDKINQKESPGTSGSTGRAAGKKLRHWVMVIDLKKCEGCTTVGDIPQCTKACIEGHMIPTGPNGEWVQQWIQVFKEKIAGGGNYYMPVPCQQCENAPCANVCPVGATYHNEEGIVLIDHRRCIGCRLCMAACPYSRRFFNWGEPNQPPAAKLATYSPEFPVPYIKGTVVKCIFCAHNAHNGKLPICVQGCPMNALYFGDLEEDIATNKVEIVELSKFLAKNNAYRLKEELGTQPRVYYLPGHGEEFRGHNFERKKS